MVDVQRIAKTLSRAGIASRREAEKLILNGEISVNGVVINDLATKVNSKDKIRFNGKLVSAPDSTRLWRYYKPVGLVTTHSDEKGRPTIYEKLPENLPRLMSIGRLDITSEGLLLLTNDGEFKRHLELPSNGFVRKYRVRANGTHSELLLDKLRKGISIDNKKFRPMEVVLDRINGANVWYNVSLTEGRNREIRRSFDQISMTVNRLIRTSFAGLDLGILDKGDIVEVPKQIVKKSFRF
mgnify:CR=1 FL=1